jgi:hypothetical protein
LLSKTSLPLFISGLKVWFFVFLVKKKKTPPLYIIYQAGNEEGCFWGSAIKRACWLVVEQKTNSIAKNFNLLIKNTCNQVKSAGKLLSLFW